MSNHIHLPSSISAALVLVATFVLGGVTGGAIVHTFAGQHPVPPPFMPPPPWEGIDLTSQQRDQIHEVLERYRPTLDETLREVFPKARTISDELDKEIRKLLTPAQQRVFDEHKARQRSLQPHPQAPMPGPLQPLHAPPEAFRACEGHQLGSPCDLRFPNAAPVGRCAVDPGGQAQTFVCVPVGEPPDAG